MFFQRMYWNEYKKKIGLFFVFIWVWFWSRQSRDLQNATEKPNIITSWCEDLSNAESTLVLKHINIVLKHIKMQKTSYGNGPKTITSPSACQDNHPTFFDIPPRPRGFCGAYAVSSVCALYAVYAWEHQAAANRPRFPLSGRACSMVHFL